MDNYEFCAQWALQHGKRILDYGCGNGNLVSLLRMHGAEAYGCDVFYEGGAFQLLPDASTYIRRMEADRIPFDDHSFDVVISNQVLEHVPDIDLVAREIARVLKPGGRSLHVFPDAGVLTEPHSKIPLLHWFPKGARWRLPYAALMRVLRYGRKARPVIETTRKRIAWVDEWTHFRSYLAIQAAFGHHFDVSYLESQWLDARRAMPIPSFLKRSIVRRLAGTVMALQLR